MACGTTIGSLNAFRRITVVDDTAEQFFVSTDWMLLTGLEVRGWLNMLDEGGAGVEARLAYQTATVVTDQPGTIGGRSDWVGYGSVVGSASFHAFGNLTGLPTDKQWIRFGIAASKDAPSPSFGQADISAMYQVKPCGKVVGDVNAAGIEVEATRDIPVSEWFETVDVSDTRIGYYLDADASVRIDWYIQVSNDTNRPGSATPITGATQVAGQGLGSYDQGNTSNLDLSGDLSPANPTLTPAYARIMARLSSTSGAATIGQLVVNVQVM